MNFLYFDGRFLDHQTGNHPERPDRLVHCRQALRSTGQWDRWQHPEFNPAELPDIERVHDQQVPRLIQQACQARMPLDADTPVSVESYDAALLAAGAAISAAAATTEGEAKRAFCLIRPPGHHATPDRSMGFCLLNNVAIAAAYAIDRLKIERVLIVDWDVHHGNGTQDIFWRNGQVGFFSMHRYPFYPGSGDRDAVGEGRGRGWTCNLPIEYGTSREKILDRFEQQLRDFAEHVRPQLVLISAGFDAHRDDPIGDLGLETADFGVLTNMVVQIANTWCDGRIVSLLEGGYHLERLAESVSLHLERLTVC